jgi:hypothetical protein
MKLWQKEPPNLGKEMNIQVHESLRTPNRHEQKRTSPCNMIVKIPRVHYKEKIPKASRGKYQVTFKGNDIIIIAYLLTGTIKAKRAWTDVFQSLKQSNCPPRLYAEKLSFKIERQMNFDDKHKLNQLWPLIQHCRR